MKPKSLALAGGFLPTVPPGKSLGFLHLLVWTPFPMMSDTLLPNLQKSICVSLSLLGLTTSVRGCVCFTFPGETDLELWINLN